MKGSLSAPPALVNRANVGFSNLEKIDALTGARFFAAILVVLYHRGLIALTAVSPVVARPAQIGFVSVGFFYALSGFVLTLAYSNRKFDSKSFYVSRFARIYPLYALALILSIPGFWIKWHSGEITSAQSWGALFLAPLLLQAWLPATTLLWNGPGWSLSCEAFFYLIFPLLLPRFLKLTRRRLYLSLTGLFAASLIPTMLFHYANGWDSVAAEASQTIRVPTAFSFWSDLISFNPLSRIPEFLAGIVTGCLSLRGKPVDASRKGTGLVVIAAIVLLTATLCAQELPALVLHNGLLLPVWLLLITGLYWKGFPERLLSVRPIVFLGEISYAIYILQSPVSGYLGVALRPILHLSFVGQYPNISSLILYVALLTALSAISFIYFERPTRDYINQHWRQRRACRK